MDHTFQPLSPTQVELDTTLLKPSDVAVRLGISRSQVYTLVDAGCLRTVKIGRSVRVPLRSLFDYVQHLKAASGLLHDTPPSDFGR